jgi:hypothetical protein
MMGSKSGWARHPLAGAPDLRLAAPKPFGPTVAELPALPRQYYAAAATVFTSVSRPTGFSSTATAPNCPALTLSSSVRKPEHTTIRLSGAVTRNTASASIGAIC